MTALEGESPAGTPIEAQATADSATVEPAWVTVEGVGLTATDKFSLDEGRYRLHATVDAKAQVSGFIAHIYDPSGGDELIFNELIQDGPKEWVGEAIYTAPSTGDYFIEVSNTSESWSIAFEPF